MAGGTGKIIHQMRAAGTTLTDWKTVTGHATDQTLKGTPIELVAALPDDVQFVKLMAQGSRLGAGDSSMLLDILVDSGGGDEVKIPNFLVGNIDVPGSTVPGPRLWGLPIAIPAGAKVSAQVATIIDADTVGVAMDFYGGFSAAAGEPADSIDTLGISIANVKGVGLLTGLANAKGLWTEIEDSTPNDYKALAVSVQSSGTVMSIGSWFIDVGVGAATFEEPVVSDISFWTNTQEGVTNVVDFGVFPLENAIPAGSRISVRAQSTLAANTDINVAVHGIK